MKKQIDIADDQIAVLTVDDQQEVTAQVVNEGNNRVLRIRCDGNLVVFPVSTNGINLMVR